MAIIYRSIVRNNRILICLAIAFTLGTGNVPGQVLYECKSPSGDTVTYVLGTHHYLPPEYRFPSLASSLIAISDIIFVENDSKSTAEDRKKLQADFTSGITLFENGKKLSDFVSKKKMAEITAFYEKQFGLSRKQVASKLYLRPFYMHNYLTTMDITHGSVDDAARDRAYEYKKPVVSLDEPDNLRVTYTWLANSISPDSLYNYIRTYENNPQDSVPDLDNAYLRGDTASIRLYMDSFTPEAREILITTRNRKWEKILLQQSRQVNFIAVGTAHLLDYDGLLQFYRSRGYRVRGVETD